MNKKQKKERAFLRNAQREQNNSLAPSKEELEKMKVEEFVEFLSYKTSEILEEKFLLGKEIYQGEMILLSYCSEEIEGKVTDIVDSTDKLEVKIRYNFKFKQTEETQFLPNPQVIRWIRIKRITYIGYESHEETLERRRWANEL